MKKPFFYFIAGFGTVFAPIGIFLIFIWIFVFTFADLTEHQPQKADVSILSSTTSPNQKFIATTFANSGGGAASSCGLKVNVRNSDKQFDSNETVFVASCGTKIKTVWEDDKTLRITYSTENKILSLQQKGWDVDKTVKIIYGSE